MRAQGQIEKRQIEREADSKAAPQAYRIYQSCRFIQSK